MRVLVVEDERKLAQVLMAALEAERYDVVVAATGEDGFYRANAELFDLVLLDLMLPGRSGLEISDSDISGATHLFAIGCTLPDKALVSGKAADWSDVPDDQGYGPMRDAIVRHVKQLLNELER